MDIFNRAFPKTNVSKSSAVKPDSAISTPKTISKKPTPPASATPPPPPKVHKTPELNASKERPSPIKSTPASSLVGGGANALNLPIPVTSIYGGTGADLSAAVSGSMPYFNAAGVMGSSALLASGALIVGGGAGVAPATLGSTGTATTVLHGNPSGPPTFSAVALGAGGDVAGTLGVTNGGTGTNTAFTTGSVVFAGASGVYSQDNSNFFWDDTNNRLSVGGGASPANVLLVQGTTNPLSVFQNTTATTTTTLHRYLVPNLAASNQVVLELGRANTTNNSGILTFTYSSSGSATANLLTLGLFGSNSLVTLNGNGDTTLTAGSLLINTAGKGLAVKASLTTTGTSVTTQARFGTCEMNGTAGFTINNTTVTSNTQMLITRKTNSGTLGNIYYTINAGTSAVILSTSALDTTSVVSWLMIEAIP